MSDETENETTDTGLHLGKWILPGRITERATEGNRWMEDTRVRMLCSRCHAEIAGPTYYEVVFHAAPEPNGAHYGRVSCDTCSRECAEQLATLRPTHPAHVQLSEGNPTDPATRQD